MDIKEKIKCAGFTLEAVKIEGGWAQKATLTETGESRYRTYHYKAEAEKGLNEWTNYQPVAMFMREFHHNFWFGCDEVKEIQ